MESGKAHIRHCLLFCFHQKKSAADAGLFMRHLMKMF